MTSDAVPIDIEDSLRKGMEEMVQKLTDDGDEGHPGKEKRGPRITLDFCPRVSAAARGRLLILRRNLSNHETGWFMTMMAEVSGIRDLREQNRRMLIQPRHVHQHAPRILMNSPEARRRLIQAYFSGPIAEVDLFVLDEQADSDLFPQFRAAAAAEYEMWMQCYPHYPHYNYCWGRPFTN